MTAFEIEREVAVFARDLGIMVIKLPYIPNRLKCADLFITPSEEVWFGIFKTEVVAMTGRQRDFIRDLKNRGQTVRIIRSVREGTQMVQEML
ncbi:hypothetical protein [Thiolapillus sp.]|uniref:hypothetical protein n=1 Tax=Thiolapillus sp. TaxID=2017437 RepID=UPI003AF45762